MPTTGKNFLASRTLEFDGAGLAFGLALEQSTDPLSASPFLTIRSGNHLEFSDGSDDESRFVVGTAETLEQMGHALLELARRAASDGFFGSGRRRR